MIGKTISHYRILEKLGEGGMGVVYKAEDTELKRNVAIKFLPSHISSNEEERQRFKVEAQAAAALNHPNIGTIYNIEDVDNETFIVMEYIDGQELKDKIEDGPLPINDIMNLAVQIAKGLQTAHEKGVVHRDIKSANIMLTNKGDVKIMDFGLAKVRGGPKLTKEQSTLGTAAYMSPEQARGEEVDFRSDIFSFGVLLYEMLTGQLPFKGDYDQAVTYSLLNEDQEPVTALRTGVPMELERIVNKCLKKDVSGRYQHTEELITDLNELKRESDTKEMLSKTGVRPVQIERKKMGFVVPAIIGTVIIVAIVSYFFLSKAPETTERVPIAVVDFVNETNEPELSGLSGMLITALEQSRHLDVMSRTRMFDELKKMGREEVTFVDEPTGRELARHARVAALAIATIRKFGQTYTIDFKVIDPENGDNLFATKEEGTGQESVPGMIDNLSQKTRIDLKEEANLVQMTRKNIGDVTTTNLEAYHHYFLGEQHMRHLRSSEAEDEYRKAIALDSTFALAFYRLAYAINWTPGSRQLARNPLDKAISLIDRIPEKEQFLVRALDNKIKEGYSASIEVLKEMERYYPNDKDILYNIGDDATHDGQFDTAIRYLDKVLILDPEYEPAIMHMVMSNKGAGNYDQMNLFIDSLAALNPREAFFHRAMYHRDVGEFEAAIQNFKEALKIDPDDIGSVNSLVIALIRARQYEKALEYSERLLALRNYPLAYWRKADALLGMGDFESALQTYQAGLRKFPQDILMLGNMGWVYAYGQKYDKAEAYFNEMANEGQTDRIRQDGLRQLRRFYHYVGKYSKIETAYDERIKESKSRNDTTALARVLAFKAINMFRGYKDKKEVMATIEEINQFEGIDINWQIFDLYIAIGDGNKAELVAKNLDHTFGNSRLWTEAFLDFAKGRWEDASTKFDRLTYLQPNPDSGYFSAICYFEMGNLEAATSRIKQSQIDYSWRHGIFYPPSLLLLGKIYEERGDTQLAIQNYEKFLDLWKNADEDLPDLIDAKARLAKLKGEAAN